MRLPSKLNQSTEWRSGGGERERELEQTDSECGATLERKGEHVLGEKRVKVWRAGPTWRAALHETCENPCIKPAFLPHCGRESKTL